MSLFGRPRRSRGVRFCVGSFGRLAAGRAFVLVCLIAAVLQQARGACNHRCRKGSAVIGYACVGACKAMIQLGCDR